MLSLGPDHPPQHVGIAGEPDRLVQNKRGDSGRFKRDVAIPAM
jgi:hypothetical protein